MIYLYVFINSYKSTNLDDTIPSMRLQVFAARAKRGLASRTFSSSFTCLFIVIALVITYCINPNYHPYQDIVLPGFAFTNLHSSSSASLSVFPALFVFNGGFNLFINSCSFSRNSSSVSHEKL